MTGPIGEPYRFPVELGKIREFARATRATAAGAGLGAAPVAPPTFLITSAMWSAWYDSYLAQLASLGDLLHAEQEFEYPHGPPVAGVVLTVRESLESSDTTLGKRGWQRERRVVAAEFSDATGATVARSRATFVIMTRIMGRPDGAS